MEDEPWGRVSEVLTFAVDVAISPAPIIAVILMLFSQRARVNGPLFLLGWVLALTIINAVTDVLADQGDVATSTGASDTVAWGKIVFGVAFLLLAGRQWRSKPPPGTEPEMPKWIAPRWFIVTFWHAYRVIVRVTGGRTGLWPPRPGKWAPYGSPRRVGAAPSLGA